MIVPIADMTVVLAPDADVVTEMAGGVIAVVVITEGFIPGGCVSHLVFLFWSAEN